MEERRFTYAWNWFAYHANQRLTAFHFFLIIFGALIIGYSQSIDKSAWISLGIAIFGAFISWVFVLLDVRNEELVNCGRDALDKIEKDMGMEIRANDKARVFYEEATNGECLARCVSKEHLKHRSLFRNIEKLSFLIFIIGIIFAICVLNGSIAIKLTQ